jgi:hypothetical protein
MPSTLAVIKLVQQLAGCSQADAHRVGHAICRDPEALDLFATTALKCGAAVAGTGAGGMIFVSGLTPVSAPNLVVGAALTGGALVAAKKFCGELVSRGTHDVPGDVKDLLRE